MQALCFDTRDLVRPLAVSLHLLRAANSRVGRRVGAPVILFVISNASSSTAAGSSTEAGVCDPASLTRRALRISLRENSPGSTPAIDYTNDSHVRPHTAWQPVTNALKWRSCLLGEGKTSRGAHPAANTIGNAKRAAGGCDVKRVLAPLLHLLWMWDHESSCRQAQLVHASTALVPARWITALSLVLERSACSRTSAHKSNGSNSACARTVRHDLT